MPATAIQPISSKDFTLEAEVARSQLLLRLAGTADMSVMDAFASALARAHEEAKGLGLNEVCLDLQSVFFLNSTCLKNITTLALSAKAASYKLRLLLNPRLTWQMRAVAPIERLAEGAVLIENAKQ